MKCYEVRIWLYSTTADEPLPATIERHLEECVRCRTKRRVLGRLDERVRALPIPAGSPAAKDEFFKRLAETPGPAAARPAPRRAKGYAIYWLAGLAAACVLLIAGGMIGRWTAPMSMQMADRRPVPVASVEVVKKKVMALPVNPVTTETPAIVKSLVPPPPPEKTTTAVPTSDPERPSAEPKVDPVTAKKDPFPEPIPKSKPKIDVNPFEQPLKNVPKNLDLVVRLLKHDTNLAESTNPVQQVKLLDAMAEDLRTELLDSVRRESPGESQELAELYSVVLRGGLTPRIERLPAQTRGLETFGAMGNRYKSVAKELANRSEKTASDPLRSASAAASDAANDVVSAIAGRPTAALPPQSGERTLLRKLVDYGLEAAAEPSPLKRATLCNEFAIRVTPSLLQLSGPPTQSVALGTALGDWLDRAVAGNLERTDSAEAAEARKVRARAALAFETLEAELANSPADIQDKARRVLDASAPGWQRVAGVQKKSSE